MQPWRRPLDELGFELVELDDYLRVPRRPRLGCDRSLSSATTAALPDVEAPLTREPVRLLNIEALARCS
jgi:hypothetical protein